MTALQPNSSERPRFLSEADCRDIAQRLVRYSKGGGEAMVHIVSRWSGNIRWGRTRINTTGEDRDNRIRVMRSLRGALGGPCTINSVSDPAIVAAVRRAERLLNNRAEQFNADVAIRPGSRFRYQPESAAEPQLFFDSTYQLDAAQRADTAHRMMQSAATTGMLAAGYLEVSATSFASIMSWGYTRYYQYTWAQCSMTVRDPHGTGSGWAGVDWPDWNKIDATRLAEIALDKCLRSRNPVAVEPGRYTTILESQAVCDLLSPWGVREGRASSETNSETPFHKSGAEEPPYWYGVHGTRPGQYPHLGLARFGEQVIDERLTLSADPLDPELGFPPYEMDPYAETDEAVYHPVTWIEHGVLKHLSYDRAYAIRRLGQNTGLPTSGAFRMSVSGPTASIEEMVATTKRGLLVTRFDQVSDPVGPARLCRGFTRDGLWLIENGTITKPVKNMLFVESVLFALNNVEQVGVPQRAFHPGGIWMGVWHFNPQPVVVPALKVRDFSFTALSGSV